MSSIPEEIYNEILLRLPVKSLLRCNSVCKNWYALISASDFVKLHHNLTIQRNNPDLMLRFENDSDYSDEIYSIGYNSLTSSSPVSKIRKDVIKLDYPFKSLDYDASLLGSCNGLICTWLRNGRSDFLCLWNPATREYKKIATAAFEFKVCMYGFGYDPKTDDYKLAIGLGDHESSDSGLVRVYSLASDSWKTKKTMPYQFPYEQKHGVLVNGDVNWLGFAKKDLFLVSMDISGESFKEMQLPRDIFKRIEDLYLELLEGRLCILVRSVHGFQFHIEVWEMLENGVRESWTRRYIINHVSKSAMTHILGLCGLLKMARFYS